MIVKTQIEQGKYLDSVKLMLISKELRQQDGVIDAVAIMATKENREILAVTDMLVESIRNAQETDIVIVIKAESSEQAELALKKADSLLKEQPRKRAETGPIVRTITSAIKALNHEDTDESSPAINGSSTLCLISVAGKYAAAEAETALENGLHVMIFSDNVSLEDELRLKQTARARGLLMMGPDCGTAIVNGCPLGFANQIPRGEIGLVSAAGTGLQEVSVAIAHLGKGISQAFGTGGRDGKKMIGGIMLCACLDYLINDPATRVIIVIAKTPDKEVQERIWQKIQGTKKEVVVSFLLPLEHPDLPNLHYTESLAKSAEMACKLVGGEPVSISPEADLNAEALPQPGAGRKHIIGLYSGGTLCYEAQQMYLNIFEQYPFSNAPLSPEYETKDVWEGPGDCFIDLGSDEFTVSRAHPMIDYSLRLQMLKHMAERRDVAIILLDIVLGYGAHPDPASELIPVLSAISPEIPVICQVLGTDQDPQNASMQIDKLKAAGAQVFRYHRQAADFALQLLRQMRRIG